MNERSFIVKWPCFYEAIRSCWLSSRTLPVARTGNVAGCSANCQITAKALTANSAYNTVSKTFLLFSSD